MPVTIHKLMCHAKEIISSFMVPNGQISAEAQEARNKEIRRVREYHTRKTSRTSTNENMFLYLLVASDPKIATIRKFANKKTNLYHTMC